MKSEQEIRKDVKRLWKEYQDLGYDETTDEHELDIALAKFEALNSVFEDEYE